MVVRRLAVVTEPVTDAPVITPTETTAPDTEEDTASEPASGCASALIALPVVTVLTAAVVLLRKKERDA